MLDFERVDGFDWDDGNSGKNWNKHRVTDAECEEPFLNTPLFVASDVAHSEGEARYYALGRTNQGRRLFIAFTVRGARIRVISARDMTRRERSYYPL